MRHLLKENEDVRKIIVLIEAQKLLVSNPIKKMYIRWHLNYIKDALVLADQEGKQIDKHRIYKILTMRELELRSKGHLSVWEIKWLELLQEGIYLL